MKKYIKVLLIVLFVFLFSGCEIQNDTGLVKLPNLDGLSREEISTKLDKLGIKYTFQCVPRLYINDEEYDKFVEYGNGLKKFDLVDSNSFIYIYTTALPLPDNNICDVEMDFEYEGKTFINDGVEKVTLARGIDGDTAHFYTQDGTYIKVRFLGVNTPESTYVEEPWGKEASLFTSQILYNAKTIVIESEGNIKDTYDRYLAFVWADGVLVNLELVQNGYSNSKLSSSSKYFDAFYETEYAISLTGRKIWGEIDPGYDYENNEFK